MGVVEAGQGPAADRQYILDTRTVDRLLEAYLENRAEEGFRSVK
jgi:hypothetical protein